MNRNRSVALSLLRDEVEGNLDAALSKLSHNYSMTWVYKSPTTGILFPRSDRSHRDARFQRALKKIYSIRGRMYDVKNIAEGKNLVMIELVESYRDARTGRCFRTPLVLVLKFKKGKVHTGRHYCDPTLSHLHLSKRVIEKAFAE